ncbi:unnamed protein product [Clonostachys rosea]|uniref:Peptidase A1 domain-containing protein n=1 Tax=Bionectria ochroleuca TaxID=29856 RepID=A0ABY6UPW0_BIOOC|nr:unnamed protein product [Clonostachys rosea]
MRSLVLGVVCSLLAGQVVDADFGFPKAKRGEGFLSVPIGTVDRPHSAKRDTKAIVSELDNRDFFYTTDVEIGSPPQKLTLLVDTGSSELWVNPDCANAPSDTQVQQCKSFGRYTPKNSKTPAIGPFGNESIRYGDAADSSTHTSVNLTYYADDITLGDAVIKNQTFGAVVASSGQFAGIFGLAPDMKSGFDGKEPYSLVLNSMLDQGIIAARVFSLDLRHSQSTTGAVIYGGIDKSKFIGTLEKLPTIRGSSGEYRLGVSINTMGITIKGQNSTYQLLGDDKKVMLDSGTTITRLRETAAKPILKSLGAIQDTNGYYLVDCKKREEAGSVSFGFGNKTIAVPFSDIIMDFQAAAGLCVVGIVLTTDQQILGDTVLRAGYFTFDWESESVHVAQAANCGDNDIVAVSKGDDPVPSVTGNCQEKDALFTGGPVSTSSQASATQTSSGSSQATQSSGSQGNSGNGSSNDEGAGAHVPVVTWTLMAAAGAGFFLNLLA